MLFRRSVNNIFFHSVKHVEFRAKKRVFAGNFTALLFSKKKSAAETHRVLVETYGDHALSETTCRNWFRCFKNNDFDVEEKERSGAPKKFEDEKLEALLNEDSCQMQNELVESLGVDHATVAKRLKALGMIQKQGNWVPYELKQQELIQAPNKKLSIWSLYIYIDLIFKPVK